MIFRCTDRHTDQPSHTGQSSLPLFRMLATPATWWAHCGLKKGVPLPLLLGRLSRRAQLPTHWVGERPTPSPGTFLLSPLTTRAPQMNVESQQSSAQQDRTPTFLKLLQKSRESQLSPGPRAVEGWAASGVFRPSVWGNRLGEPGIKPRGGGGGDRRPEGKPKAPCQ